VLVVLAKAIHLGMKVLVTTGVVRAQAHGEIDIARVLRAVALEDAPLPDARYRLAVLWIGRRSPIERNLERGSLAVHAAPARKLLGLGWCGFRNELLRQVDGK